MPSRMRFGTALTQFRCNARPEMIHPASDCLVRDCNSSLGEQILDVAKAEREPVIKPNRLLMRLHPVVRNPDIQRSLFFSCSPAIRIQGLLRVDVTLPRQGQRPACGSSFDRAGTGRPLILGDEAQGADAHHCRRLPAGHAYYAAVRERYRPASGPPSKASVGGHLRRGQTLSVLPPTPHQSGLQRQSRRRNSPVLVLYTPAQ